MSNSLSNQVLCKILAFPLSFLIVSCSDSQTAKQGQTALGADVAPGIILVDILEGGQTEHYWQFEVQPTTGIIRKVMEKTFNYKDENIPYEYHEPAGAIETCAKNPQARSPDEESLAYCTSTKRDGPIEFYVVNKKLPKTFVWKPDKGIQGFAWAPNSHSVAILSTSGHVGLRPLELLSLLSGHPVPHDTIFLEIMDAKTGTISEYVVRRDVISSFTRILSWTRP